MFEYWMTDETLHTPIAVIWSDVRGKLMVLQSCDHFPTDVWLLT